MERPICSVGTDSWHYRFYNSWVSRDWRREKDRENLCHYMRVVLIYAPIEWFFIWFTGKNLVSGKLRFPVYPWTILLSIIFLGIFYLYPLDTVLAVAGLVIWLGLGSFALGRSLKLVDLIYEDGRQRKNKRDALEALSGLLIVFMPMGIVVWVIYYLNYQVELKERNKPQPVDEEEKRGDNFLTFVWEFFVSWKMKHCPFLEFVEKKEKSG